MKELEIESAEVFAVTPPVERYRLAGDMGEVFETLTLLRLNTRCGAQGFAGITTYSEHDFDSASAAALKSLLPELMGRNAWDTDTIWQHLMGRYNSMTPKPQSVIDIALWDLKAKALDLPLYRLLGGSRNSIDAYASTPVFDHPSEYVTFVRQLLAQGHRTIKFHVWCNLEQDLALLDTIDEVFGSKLPFMIDLEERYSRQDALVIAKRLEQMNCVWLEAPLPDTDLAGYAELRNASTVPILPAGNTLLTPGLLNLALKEDAWDALRTDVTYAGGFTAGRTIAALAQANNLDLELQSWGYSLTQAANLHLMLSLPNSQFFEQPVPYPSHEACCLTPIRTVDGQVQAPSGAGLGIEMDWQAVQDHSIWHYTIGG